MKIKGGKIPVEYTPLRVGGSLNIQGGSVVQFFDGNDFYPNREGTLSSPILLTHQLSIHDPDANQEITPAMNTTFYEDDVVISAATSGYELIGAHAVKVVKNITANTQVVIKALTEFVDPRNNRIYKREDFITLRTILKAEAQYTIELTPHGAVYFDAYRSPNTQAQIVAKLSHGDAEVTDLTGITLKWLNPDSLDIVENELYGVSYSADKRTLTIDKTYINKETITCEAWKDGKIISTATVTFVRKFNPYRLDVNIVGLPLLPGVNNIRCICTITDTIGPVDVNAAFLLRWMVREDGFERQLGTGTPFIFTRSDVNMNAATLEVYPDLKRREAYAALTDEFGTPLTDEYGNILTAETYGI
ncbi:MAG: hypothetical protein AAGU18_10710 [Proteiniphilum sp.]